MEDPNSRINYLIREIVGVEYDFNVAGFADERLWLLCLSAERSRLPSIGHICFSVPVHDLKCAKK